MVDINRFFPSKYLRPTDLEGVPILTIRSVEMISLNGQQKLLCQFHELAKGLILNVGNSRKIADVVGSANTDDWIGHRVALKVMPTSFQGTTVNGIRVVPPSRPATAGTRSASVPADPEPDEDASPDDVAF